MPKPRKRAARPEPDLCWGCEGSSLPVDGDGLCFLCRNQIDEKPKRASNYPGDCVTKKLARYNTYWEIKQIWEKSGTPKGWVVLLAGDEAAEVGCVLNLLRWPANHVIVVDLNPRGLHAAQERFPGVRTYQGNVLDVIEALPEDSISLIHLDFQGHFKESEASFVRATRQKLRRGAFLLYTFMHGRDKSKPYYAPTRVRGRTALGQLPEDERKALSPREESKFVRATGTMLRIMKAMSADSGDVWGPFGINYNSGSPMELLALMYWPGFVKRMRKNKRRVEAGKKPCVPDWYYEMFTTKPFRVPIVYTEDRHIRILALRLLSWPWPDRELTAKEVAEILNIKKATVAAWKAHETMGTY